MTDRLRPAAAAAFAWLAAALCGLAVSGGPAAAQSPSLAQLAGFWLSIDDTHPDLWRQRYTVPAEEVLVIAADGAVENRYLTFTIPSATGCRASEACSDFPYLQTARLTLQDDLLRVSDRGRDLPKGSTVLTSRDLDRMVHDRSVTQSPYWLVSLSAGGRILHLRRPDGTGAPRVFAKVDSQRLIRLRAAFILLQQNPTAHWRCFLASATFGDPAFAPIAKSFISGAPQDFDDLLITASYLLALQTAIAESGFDRPEGLSSSLVERFPGIRAAPGDFDALGRLQLQRSYLELRLSGRSMTEAQNLIAERGQGPALVDLPEYQVLTLANARTSPLIKHMLTCD